MTTALGVCHLTRKLRGCDTLSDLATVWSGISPAYQRHPDVLATKEERKAALGGVAA